MSAIGSVSFWIDTTERTLRSFAQGILTAWGLSLPMIGGLNVPLHVALVAGACYSALTIVTCMGSLVIPKADKDTGSFLAIPPYQLIKLRSWVTRRRHRNGGGS